MGCLQEALLQQRSPVTMTFGVIPNHQRTALGRAMMQAEKTIARPELFEDQFASAQR
jgi:hypothetical protein